MPMLNRSSATIYQFPVGGRASRPDTARRQPETAVPTAPFGSGWYHDDAIEEAAEEARRRH